LRAHQKKVSDEVSQKKRKGEDAAELIAEMKKVSQELKGLDGVVEEKEKTLQEILLFIPNLPHSSVPKGQRLRNVKLALGRDSKFDFQSTGY
jgi:seryl-tRNA synthetase